MTTRASDNGTVRNDPPAPDDFALVVRPIGGSSSGDEISTPTTGTLTSVAASVAPVPLLAANAARAGFSIRNNSTTATLFVLANTTPAVVSSSFHTVALIPGAYYEDPYNYVGDVTGIWSAVDGNALITEYIPEP